LAESATYSMATGSKQFHEPFWRMSRLRVFFTEGRKEREELCESS